MEDLYALKAAFLKTWPIDRIKNMQLSEYTNLNRADSFCYWVEFKIDEVGIVSP